MGTGEFNAEGVILQWSNIPSRREVEIVGVGPLVASFYRNSKSSSLMGRLTHTQTLHLPTNFYVFSFKVVHLPVKVCLQYTGYSLC